MQVAQQCWDCPALTKPRAKGCWTFRPEFHLAEWHSVERTRLLQGPALERGELLALSKARNFLRNR